MTSSSIRLAGLAVAAAAMSASPAAAAEKYWAFFGGYGPGIFRSEFDPATGTLSEPVLAVKAGNPSFLAIHPKQNFLYAVGEGGPSGGGVFSFSLDAKTGELKHLNTQSAGGPGSCHLCVDKTGSCVLVANYGGGSCGSLGINADGSLAEMKSFHQHKDGGTAAKPKKPRGHSANVDAGNNFAIVADLGLDQLLVYKLDAAKATMTPHDPPFLATPPGSGPRHFAFHPNGKFAYACGELDSTVIAMTYDAAKGTLATVNTASTLPGGKMVKGNSTAEVQIHPGGKHAFVSNRGHNSIAVFALNPETGAATPAGHLTGDIKVPRNFSIDPTGKWIVVANQDSDSVVVFSWDDAAGTGKVTDVKIKVAKPVCVKFVAVAK